MSLRHAAITIVLFAAVLSGGCVTTPGSRFYTLGVEPAQAAAPPSQLSLSLGPIDLPRYLDRPQIVTRAAGNRLNVDEFNRWGGSLEEEVHRVLAQRLGGRLGTQRIYSYPSRIVAQTDYRVALDIRTFDGALGGEVQLDVAWSLIDDRTAAVLEAGRKTYSDTASGPEYSAYTQALSGLVARLADDLGAVLLEAGKTGQP